MRDVQRFFTPKTLALGYGISVMGLKNWYPHAGIIPPKRGGYFKDSDVQAADLFYIATKIHRLTHKEYTELVIPAGGLNKFFLKYHRMSLLEYLTQFLSEIDQNNVIVQEVITRFTEQKNETHQSSSYRARGIA